MSLDGGANILLKDYLKSTLPENTGFGKMKKRGQLATQGLTVSLPSLTATSHISLITGKTPGEHGIVSNNFHVVTDPISKRTNGFAASWDKNVKTIWEQLIAQGKKVGVISYPGLDNKDKRRSATWSVNFSKSVAPSFLKKFRSQDFDNYKGLFPSDLRSFSTPKITKMMLTDSDPDSNSNSPGLQSKVRAFYVMVLDATNDKRRNYDTIVFDRDSNLKNGYVAKVNASSPWAPISYKSKGVLKGSWCKLVKLSKSLSNNLTDTALPDEAKSAVQIYVGPTYATQAFPNKFQRLIDREVGFWPGPPGRNFLEMGLNEEDFFIIAKRLSEYLKNVTLLGAQTQKWDVILTYQPILDELEHRFYMTNAKQKDYSAATKKYYMGLIQRGYLQANTVIEDFTRALPQSNLVVVSDHGMSPLHTVYYPNRVLMRLGFIEAVSDEDSEAGKRYEALAFSSGGLSHIYINLKGRGPDGFVTPSNFEKIKNRLVKYFRLKNKNNPIASVYTRADLKKIGLNHPNSGDIVLVAKPGYHLTDMMGNGELTEPASFYGQHGQDPSLPEMKGIFGAFGPDIESKTLSRFHYKKVLPFILKLLKD